MGVGSTIRREKQPRNMEMVVFTIISFSFSLQSSRRKITMSDIINSKKRKADGAPNEVMGKSVEELLLEIKTEILSELADTKKEVLELKQKLDRGNVQAAFVAKNEVPSEAAKDDSDSGDDFSDVEDASDQWSIMFRQFREYRILKGTCKIPKKYAENLKLGRWADNQKLHYSNLKFGKNGQKIKEERVAKLDGIGMYWGTKFPEPPSWETRFEELKEYKTAMRCDPAVDLKNPTPLATWVSAQRNEYRRFKKGRDSLLTLEQIGKLNEVKLNWKGPRLA